MNTNEKLMNIQVELKAPKSQYNNFGKYSYRNLEDILEALKPLLIKYKAFINISDEIVMIGDRYYVKATATIVNSEESGEISAIAYAREDDTKKGMDLSQLTGSTSSYARKYALNGLFAIDDTKDSDTTNTHGNNAEPTAPVKNNTPKDNLTDAQIKRLYAIGKSRDVDKAAIDKSIITQYKKNHASELTKQEYDDLCGRLEALPKKE